MKSGGERANISVKIMSDNVTNIESVRPHLTITGNNGKVHVIPEEFFHDIVLGNTSLKELEDFDSIMPVIIGEWLTLSGFYD